MARKKKTLKTQPVQQEVPQLHLEWQTEPRTEQLLTSLMHLWETKCGRYQAARMDSIDRERIVFGAQLKTPSDTWDIFEFDAKLGCGYPRYYKTLEEAIESVDRHLSSQHDGAPVSSNKEDVLAYAHKLELDGAHARKPRPPKPIVKREAVEQAPGEDTPTAAPKEEKPRTRAARGAAGLLLDAAYTVLQEIGTPLSARDLWNAIEQRGLVSLCGQTPWATLGSRIYCDIRDNPQTRFCKEGRGLFALCPKGE